MSLQLSLWFQRPGLIQLEHRTTLLPSFGKRLTPTLLKSDGCGLRILIFLWYYSPQWLKIDWITETTSGKAFVANVASTDGTPKNNHEIVMCLVRVCISHRYSWFHYFKHFKCRIWNSNTSNKNPPSFFKCKFRLVSD